MSKTSSRLSTKLSLGIMLMAIPIFLLSLGLLFIQSRHFVHRVAGERAGSALDITMHNVKKYLLTIETATNSNSWFAERNFHPDSLFELSRRIVMLNRLIYGCSISAEPDHFPQMGHYFSVYSIFQGDSIVTKREGDYDYFRKAWYKSAITADKAIWIDPYDDDAEGGIKALETIASYCMPLRQNGHIVGVISSDLSFRGLSDIVNSATPPYPNAYFMMVGKDGRYLIHPDSTRLFKTTIFDDFEQTHIAELRTLGYEMIEGKSGSMHVDINGRACHVSYRPVPSTTWSIALVCPDKEIMRGFNRLSYLILALSIVGLLGILWLSRRMVNQALRPLAYLLGILKKMAAGQYDDKIPHTHRDDAIGRLQNSFAIMQQSIDDQASGIRQTTLQTEQRNKELSEAKLLAEKAVRQKTLFIQNVSHQIRTPLNIIAGFAQVLQENPALPEHEKAEITDMMLHNAIHFKRMVLMLFNCSDIGISEELKSKRNDVVVCNQLAHDCLDYTRRYAPNAIINVESSLPDSCTIKTNRLYLTRSLHELLFNAVKYSDGKHITLRISQTENTVRFVVEDVGKGLPNEFIDQMFEPFTKSDDLSQGLGLGLPLTKRHIVSLGGELTLDTTYHDGCRFIIDMPKS